jgi:hypothetical protein
MRTKSRSFSAMASAPSEESEGVVRKPELLSVEGEADLLGQRDGNAP